MAAAYALLAVLLARAVASDLVWVQETLYDAGTTLPDPIASIAPDPVAVALLSMGLLALGLAVGAFLVSRETGGAFALLAAATTGWFLFPYSQIPWATVLTGASARTVEAPAAAWIYGGLIVALATLEVLASAREQLLATLRTQHLLADADTAAGVSSLAATLALAGGTLALGGLLALLVAAYGADLGASVLPDPDLLYVPIALGVLVATAFWWSTRDRERS